MTRAKAIKTIKAIRVYARRDEYEALEMAIEALEHLNDKCGKWAWNDNENAYLCSVCESGYKEQPTLLGKPLFSFCPMCGCKMKGDTE